MSDRTRPLPGDTSDALESARLPSNFGLFFHRYLGYFRSEEDLANWAGIERNEQDLWKTLEDISGMIFRRKGDYSTHKALQQQHARYDHILDLRRQRWGVGTGCHIEAEVAWRLLIGLSAPSVLNNGITLHPLFGFPYLPASGIKGLLRRFRRTEIAEEVGVRPLAPRKIEERDGDTPWQQLEDLLLMPEPETSEEQAQMEERFKRLREDMDEVVERLREERRDEDGNLETEPFGGVTCGLDGLRDLSTSYRRAFGSPNRQGRVHILDALPETLMVDGKSLLERDVVTPHYREYYTGDEPPADYHDPVPVQMLAVRQGTTFVFRMTCPDEQLLSEVQGWLERAVERWGAGARTQAGYGELIAQESDAA